MSTSPQAIGLPLQLADFIKVVRIAALAAWLGFGWMTAAGAAESNADGSGAAAAILDVFPRSVAEMPAANRGSATITLAYTPSGSVWAEGLDESQVFLAELEHRQGPADSFALRVGQGGQIYSLRAAFGESVPPSYRDARSDRSPWNDEVWQFVAVCSKYNGPGSLEKAGPVPEAFARALADSPYQSTFFIHNSGAYIPGDAAVASLYCPLLAFEADAGRRTIRTLNWGLVPQVRTIHRSPVLFYGQTRDVGEGVIELTWVVHNFSTQGIVFDFLNAPWGGTRRSSLPVQAIAPPPGEQPPAAPLLTNLQPRGDSGVTIEAVKTGGWKLASVTPAAESPSLALVFGRDRNLAAERARAARGEPASQKGSGLLRDHLAHFPVYETKWKDWQTRPENSFRNYDVVEFIPRLELVPQATIWYRVFLVVNRRDRAAELAAGLVKDVDYGLLTFDPADTPLLPVHLREGRVVAPAAAGEPPAFLAYARPVPGSLPLFLLEDTATGREVISTDPYRFVPQEPLALDLPPEHPHQAYYRSVRGISLDRHTSKWKRLIGYGLVEKPKPPGAESAGFIRLSAAAGSLAPKPDDHHHDVWVKSPAPPAGHGTATESRPDGPGR
jgi:hypothetical protein